MVGLAAPLGTVAWTQLWNNYPSNCGTSSDFPCIRWPKTSNNLSVTVKIYLDYSLTLGNVDLRSDIRTFAIPQWNGAPARNPILAETSSYDNGLIWVFRGSLYDPTAWGQTVPSWNSSNRITGANVRFNDLVSWNHTFVYAPYQADSRKVTDHELGHSEGMGHSSAVALMRQGALAHWALQTDDRNGVIAIYGAYP